ncbi:ABC transporter permease/substrate-binding protein [Anaerofustis stercorihominis]|uniref:ABC transporter permease/substrate-binding protein n=1 Tax=Anaerofustis stercorihominis TaxID=214853 RepID=UPI00214A9212|nr:glycine betaine ABC transporter substrate-binding protein [Anaerofustis stercorihominis]MCR2033513.1 ABC transporter permease subunit [Anaerofustis stercorihominis]
MSEIINLFVERKSFFLGLLLEHLKISMTAIVVAGIIGLILGVLISEYRKSSKFVLSLVNFIYTIPSISLLGFLIPLSGIGNTTAIIALSIYALLPMVRNTYTGIVNIDEKLLEAAKGMGSTDFQILYKIKLPLAIPVIISGLRNMATMTIALAGIASFIGAGGLGVSIYRGITTNNTTMTVIGSFLIALLAVVIDFILGIIEKNITKRRNKGKSKKLIAIISVLVVICFGVSMFNTFNKKTINIASKPMTEQYIISEMLKEVIESETDLKVNLTQGVGGGTSNIQPGMENREFDMYPEYTSTGWNMVLKHDGFYDEKMFNKLNKEYNKKFDFSWVCNFGFNDTFGLAVRKDLAEKYDLKTYSDLAKVSNKLNFGAEYDFFERVDGYEALCKEYGFDFKKTTDLDIGLKYKAINNKKVDVMDIFTTDGQLSVSDVVVLKDDRNFFSSAMCMMVIRNEILNEYPEIKTALSKLEGVLDDNKMAKMNYDVEGNGKDAKTVSHEFLVKNHILEDK